MVVGLASGSVESRIQGPSAQLPSSAFACGKYRGFSPSMSRELISFQMVYPVIVPAGLISRVSSGSGTDHLESDRIRTALRGPTTRRPVALKKSSGLLAE